MNKEQKQLNTLENKISALLNSRKLFLENIMHELNTPITKGKLIVDTLEESKRQTILKDIFHRMEYFLKESSKIEALLSGELSLDKKEYRVVDIIDQTLDVLFLPKEKITLYKDKTIINVDFELFSIALKNILSSLVEPELFVKKNSLVIKSKKSIRSYHCKYKQEITNSIITAHNFKLEYDYKNDYYAYSITFSY